LPGGELRADDLDESAAVVEESGLDGHQSVGAARADDLQPDLTVTQRD
jgi:hypothetical protein